MALRLTLSTDITKRDSWVGPQPDGTNKPIETVHSSAGSSQTIPLYIFNDGLRESDGDNSRIYVYKSVGVMPMGHATAVKTFDGSPISPTTISFGVEDAARFNPGTKLLLTDNQFHYEEVWIRNIQSNTLIVDRAKNGTAALTVPNGSAVTARPDHIYLSMTGKDDEWAVGAKLAYPDILDVEVPHKIYFKVSTGALKTQLKIDSYIDLLGQEFPTPRY